MWEALFQNYINRNGGITQKGKIQQVADIYLDDGLLVFAYEILKKKD